MSLCPYLDLSLRSFSLAQLRRGVTEQLQSALGSQPGSTHHKNKTTLINEIVKNSSILRSLLVSKHHRILPTLNKSLATTMKLAGNVLACHTVSPALLLFQLVLRIGENRIYQEWKSSEKLRPAKFQDMKRWRSWHELSCFISL